MPGRDGKGPMGRGSGLGRGMGISDGTNDAGTARGFGFGLGLGCRRGSRNNGSCFNVVNSQNNKDLLLEQKAILENRLQSLNKALDTL